MNDDDSTGWPPGLLQDDCRGLSRWLASRPDALRRLREACAEIEAQRASAEEHAAAVEDANERDAFEAWAAEEGFDVLRDDTPKFRGYHRTTTRWARDGWLAALKWRAQADTEAAVDMDAAKRLRRVCRLVGIEGNVPDSDETLIRSLFVILGMIARAIEDQRATGGSPLGRDADWILAIGQGVTGAGFSLPVPAVPSPSAFSQLFAEMLREVQAFDSPDVDHLSEVVKGALDRMDALLDPAAGLLAVPENSATARAAREDMRLIRQALAGKGIGDATH